LSTLAEIIPFPTPPVSWSTYIPVSKRAQFILYHGLDKKTHIMYKSYQRLYEDFCYSEGHQPFPATPKKLVEWIAVHAEGSTTQGQGPLKAESIQQAISAIRSVHIDRFLSEKAFDSSAVKRAIAGARRIQSKREKNKAAPLFKKQLEHITSPAPDINNDSEWEYDPNEPPTCSLTSAQINKLNFDTALNGRVLCRDEFSSSEASLDP
jgi:hypothetical protein